MNERFSIFSLFTLGDVSVMKAIHFMHTMLRIATHPLVEKGRRQGRESVGFKCVHARTK